jgi:hypothetical protein
MRKGMVSKSQLWIDNYLNADPVGNFLLVAYNRVYDVSTYALSVPKADFLGANVGQIITSKGQSGKDATRFLEQIKKLEGKEKWKTYMV